MISVDAARAQLLRLVAPQPVEEVPLADAVGRVLARSVVAAQSQPPFPAAAMDGYAVAQEVEIGQSLRVVGEAAAGHPFDGRVGPGDAVRIFTGAQVPEGTTRILIQEDVDRDGDRITLRDDPGPGTHIRAKGADFDVGQTLTRGRLRAVELGLAAAMGHGTLPVHRPPEIAILMTGDELAWPGNALKNGQIHASNGFAIKAMLEAEGARCRLLPLVEDRVPALRAALDLAAGADLVITIGGASVGDHDLVDEAASDAGMNLAFHKVRMRPGKPLLAGTLGASTLVGLPGNPVSSIVCTIIFILPMVRAMLGLPPEPIIHEAPAAAPIPANGPREHYMRARLGEDGLQVFERQDSSLLTVLAQSNALVIRAPGQGPAEVGEPARYIAI